MSGVSDIETHSNVPVSKQSIVKSCFALSAADKTTGPDSSSELKTGDFRQRWEANLGNLGVFEDITSNNVVENEVGSAAVALAIPLRVAGLQKESPSGREQSKTICSAISSIVRIRFRGYEKHSALVAFRPHPFQLRCGRISAERQTARHLALAKPVGPQPQVDKERSNREFIHHNLRRESGVFADFRNHPASGYIGSSGAAKPSPLGPSSPEIHDPIAEPAGKPSEGALIIPINASTGGPDVDRSILTSTPRAEADGYSSTATSSQAVAPDPAIAETQAADRTLSVKPKKPIAAPAGTSISNSPSLHGNFYQESASVSASLPAQRDPETSSAHRGVASEQGANPEMPTVHALEPGSRKRERATIGEVVTQLNR